MFRKINLFNIKNTLKEQLPVEKKISFSSKEDCFIRSKEMDLRNAKIENATEFISGVGLERISTSLSNGGIWSNGVDTISFLRDNGQIKSIMIDVYNFENGLQDELIVTKDEFIKIIKTVKESRRNLSPKENEACSVLFSKISE